MFRGHIYPSRDRLTDQVSDKLDTYWVEESTQKKHPPKLINKKGKNSYMLKMDILTFLY